MNTQGTIQLSLGKPSHKTRMVLTYFLHLSVLFSLGMSSAVRSNDHQLDYNNRDDDAKNIFNHQFPVKDEAMLSAVKRDLGGWGDIFTSNNNRKSKPFHTTKRGSMEGDDVETEDTFRSLLLAVLDKEERTLKFNLIKILMKAIVNNPQ